MLLTTILKLQSLKTWNKTLFDGWPILL